MRQLSTVNDLARLGYSRSAIRWGERSGRWRKVGHGVYAEGDTEPTSVERALGTVLAAGGVASGALAGVLLDLDAVPFDGPDFTLVPTASGRRPGARRRALSADRIVVVQGIRCTDSLQTLVDLARELDDVAWERAVESALRKQLVSIQELEHAAAASPPGVARMRRVLSLRPAGAPPTESLLETARVQLARSLSEIRPPLRQVEVFASHDRFVARVDLAWPDLGLFIELDGQHHKDQPVYDARRETAIVATTGWLCGRFTWREVMHNPLATSRRLAALVAQAQRRPLTP